MSLGQHSNNDWKQPKQNKVYKTISFGAPATFILHPSKASRLSCLSVWYPCQAGFLPLLLFVNVILIRRWNHFHMEAMWLKTHLPWKKKRACSAGCYVWVGQRKSSILPLLLSQRTATHLSLNAANFATTLAFPKSKWQQCITCLSCKIRFHISSGECYDLVKMPSNSQSYICCLSKLL